MLVAMDGGAWLGAGDLGVERFRALSRTAHVRYSRDDGALQSLMTSLQNVSGIYCLETGARVLRLGLSNAGIGKRLKHHLKEAYGDQPSRTRQWPDYHEFHRRLIGRPLVIRYLGCPREHTARIEAGLLRELGDRILWQQLKSDMRRNGTADWDAVTRLFEGPPGRSAPRRPERRVNADTRTPTAGAHRRTMARGVWCITPPSRADRAIRRGEGYAAFLARSTLPVARRIRRFVNGNAAKMPLEARLSLCRGINSNRFHQTNLELILGRTLQELGAHELAYEPMQTSGKRPDYLARFADGTVFVDATHPSWNADLEREHRANERLIDVIEKEIPPGWSFIVDELPRLGMSQPIGPFRAAINQAFSSLPIPSAGTRVNVSSPDPSMPFELELRAPRLSDWRAWVAGPSAGGFIAPDLQIQAALKEKRKQLRGLPHPAIVAIGGALGAGLDDYEIALFGRSFERLGPGGRVVARGFERTGEFAKRGSGGAPTIAGVLAYISMDVTAGRDPVLFVHPRFSGALPGALLRLEVRTLGPGGAQVRPASVGGVFDRISASAAGR